MALALRNEKNLIHRMLLSDFFHLPYVLSLLIQMYLKKGSNERKNLCQRQFFPFTRRPVFSIRKYRHRPPGFRIGSKS